MTLQEAKNRIDKTGTAYLTLWNDQGEWAFIGQVDKMTTKDKEVKLSWKLPAASHVSNFTHAVIAGNGRNMYHKEEVNIRLDVGTKKYEVVWNV